MPTALGEKRVICDACKALKGLKATRHELQGTPHIRWLDECETGADPEWRWGKRQKVSVRFGLLAGLGALGAFLFVVWFSLGQSGPVAAPLSVAVEPMRDPGSLDHQEAVMTFIQFLTADSLERKADCIEDRERFFEDAPGYFGSRPLVDCRWQQEGATKVSTRLRVERVDGRLGVRVSLSVGGRPDVEGLLFDEGGLFKLRWSSFRTFEQRPVGEWLEDSVRGDEARFCLVLEGGDDYNELEKERDYLSVILWDPVLDERHAAYIHRFSRAKEQLDDLLAGRRERLPEAPHLRSEPGNLLSTAKAAPLDMRLGEAERHESPFDLFEVSVTLIRVARLGDVAGEVTLIKCIEPVLGSASPNFLSL